MKEERLTLLYSTGSRSGIHCHKQYRRTGGVKYQKSQITFLCEIN